MAKDERLYAKFTLTFADHEKVAPLSDAAFRALVEMILWSRQLESDGVLARRYASARWSPEVIAELMNNDDEKPSLTEHPKGWEIHDYAEIQETKADIEARRARNRAAGQKGGLAKAKRNASKSLSTPPSNRVSEPLAEKEKEKGGDARPETSRPVTPVAVPDVEPPRRCPTHINHTEPPNCIRCKEARIANEQWHANALDRRRAARAALKAAIDNCPLGCDENGIREIDDNQTVRCDHGITTNTTQEVAANA